MPELPEVETTANDLRKLVVGLQITDTWTNYDSPYYYGKKQIKDPKYFKKFKKEICGSQIIETGRIGKNVLIHLNNGKTILIHMKMTGHVLYGKYDFDKKKNEWAPSENGPLQDPFNGWIRFVITLSNKKHLALSDMRKFAKVTLLETNKLNEIDDLREIGPDPLQKIVSISYFTDALSKKPTGKIKTVLMDQSLISGIGNIYSDEALWLSKIHPEKIVKKLSTKNFKEIFSNVKKVLKKGINFSGDSMQDYRRPNGEPGKFQHHHKVYQRKGKECMDKNCTGTISRIVVNGRSSHFCPECQKNK